MNTVKIVFSVLQNLTLWDCFLSCLSRQDKSVYLDRTKINPRNSNRAICPLLLGSRFFVRVFFLEGHNPQAPIIAASDVSSTRM